MKRLMFLELTACLALAVSAQALDNNVSVDEESLGGVVLDRSIELMTTDGVYVKGTAVQATRQDITLKLKQVEPKGRFQGREVTIHTADISVVHLRKSGSVAWPIALGVLGGFGGGMGAGYATYAMGAERGAAAACLLGIVGGATGGALLGREAGKHTVTINVLHSSRMRMDPRGGY